MIKKLSFMVILLLFFAGCASKKALIGTEVTTKLKPVKPLNTDVHSPINLVVKASNIADFSHSNKNYFELYINKKLVQPNNKTDNATQNYTYNLQLQPGYYEVYGIYYWHGGWREEQTKVFATELVRIDPDMRTILEVKIPKDYRGIVTEKQLYFAYSTEPLYRMDSFSSEPFANSPTQNNIKSEKVKLQINADPENCDVIIDDEMVGQTPMTVWVDRNTSHVVQLSHPNYRTKMRLIDKEGLATRDKVIMLERLEPLESIYYYRPYVRGEKEQPKGEQPGNGQGQEQNGQSGQAQSEQPAQGENQSGDQPANQQESQPQAQDNQQSSGGEGQQQVN
jgi:hypothetical protein